MCKWQVLDAKPALSNPAVHPIPLRKAASFARKGGIFLGMWRRVGKGAACPAPTSSVPETLSQSSVAGLGLLRWTNEAI